MMQNDLVSVILPVYNTEKYLSECIESVVGQTYESLEIILVDDGSTDSSYIMCEDFAKKDTRIKVVHKKNAGLNMARKSGFEVSSGKWITFVDSDDVIDKNYVKFLLEGAKRHDSEMSMCGYQYFVDTYDRDSGDIITYTKSRASTVKMYLLDGRPDEHFFMQTAWGKLFSRRLVALIDWDFSNYKINEDEFMSIMYYSELKTSLAIIDNKLLYYRQRPDSIMSQNDKEYVNIHNDKRLTKFEYLAEVYDKRLDRFGHKFKDEISYWFGLHFIINLSKAYNRNKKPLTTNDKKLFNDRLDNIIKASKKYRYWNEHDAIMRYIIQTGGIDGFFEYKKDSPVVSVIVPVYNTEKFLEQSLNSIINQTYFNLDIILINDGSTDGSAEICDLFAKRDYRIRLFTQKNSGVSAARNKGLDEANGKYVTFVDSDDFLEPFAVEELIKAAKQDKLRSDIYVGGIYDYHTGGYSFNYQPHNLPIKKSFTYEYDCGNTLFHIITSINSTFAKLYNREFMERSGLRFDTKIRICEDTLFVFNASVLATGIYIIDKPVYYYRNDLANDYSAMGTMSDDRVIDFAVAFDAIYDTMVKNKLVENQDAMRAFRRGLVAHALYNIEQVEKDGAAHKLAFRYIRDELMKKYELGVEYAEDGFNKEQLKYITAGNYDDFLLLKLNGYKRRLYKMIDDKELSRKTIGQSSLPRKIASKVAPYVPERQKRLIKRAARRVRREISRIKVL